ncbi:MAG: DUF370 domain-containing protein [Clostridia bacterium]|nr:DUF370 domain-containing protein [Clostridia bacterium]
MYVRLENQTVLKTEKIVGIFDMDNTTVSKTTRAFLSKKEKEGKLKTLGYDLPKSFLLLENGEVYITQLATATILKRIQNGIK